MTASPERLEALKRLTEDFPLYAETCLKIRSKSGKVVPLQLNRAQLHVHACIEAQKAKTGKVRALLLKARQQGFSTYIGGRFYHRTSLNRGLRTFILTHEQDATDNLFEMVNRYHEHSPLKPSTGAASAKELIFDRLDSGYAIGTAGSKAVGRSKTVQLFHGCLSPDTQIIDPLSGSLRRMGDMVVGDLVRTHTGATAAISYISHLEKPALRVTLKGLGQIPLTATGEHRFWTENGWRELSDIRAGDRLLFPVATISDSDVAWPFRLPDSTRPQGGGTRETGPDSVRADYDLGRVLGLYLAEGCITKQSKSGAPSSVTFTVHEREVARTLDWLDRLAPLFRSRTSAARRDSKTVTVTVYGRSFATFVRRLCGELDGKQLPTEWRQCGEDFCRGLVHGYLAGDGHSSKSFGDRRINAPTIRSSLAVGMRDVLAALGYGWASIAFHPGRLRYGKVCKPLWTLRLSGQGVDRLCTEIGWEMPPRQRLGNYGDVVVADGYARIPVLKIESVGVVPVMDFEVDHVDHSYCTAQAATHNSEVAFWPNAKSHFAGVVQAIPDLPGTEIVLESTANGMGNEFHARWQSAEAGKGDYIAIFVPWFWSDEYRRPAPDDFELTDEEWEVLEAHDLDIDQMCWRRAKIAELGDPLLFKQEYPATAAEAFQTTGHNSFITPEVVLKARKAKCDAFGPLVIGVDPKRSETEDRFAIAWRQGRKVLKVESDSAAIDTLRAAGNLKEIIDRDRPSKMFIDAGGGTGIYDILVSWGYDEIVTLVNFGSAPVFPVAKDDNGKPMAGYANRRAEMWGRSRDWLKDEGGADIPDTDALQSDACGPGYSRDTNQRVLLESKDQMRRRSIRSSDEWDAVALTFAEPVSETVSSMRIEIPNYGVA